MASSIMVESRTADAGGMAVPLRCPECLAPLVRSETSLVCDGCHRRYSDDEGIADVRGNRDAYFAEFDQAKMSRLLSAIPQAGVHRALGDLLRDSGAPPRLGEYILGAGRAGWKFFLPIGPQTVALDLGCGWGTLAYSFAESCRHVVAMDSTRERMQFLQLRAREQGQHRLQFVCGGDGRHLPFAEKTFDLVVVNGVLEWVPCGSDDDPRTAQLKFLREIRRVLRDSGQLYLAIENRYSWKTWFRDADGHSGLRFVPWLPRAAANLYSRLRGRGRYRNYLYGERQLRALLRAAGFEHATFYVPLPGYHHPTAIVPLEDRRAIRREVSNPSGPVRQRWRREARAILDARFPGNFNVIAGISKPEPGFLDRLLSEMHSKLTRGESQSAVVEKYRINGEMGMVTILVAFGEQRFVVKLPLDARAREGLDREAARLIEAARGANPLSGVRDFLPQVALEGEQDGQQFAVFRFVPGATGDRLARQPALADNLLDKAGGFLAEVHRLTAGSFAGEVPRLTDLVETRIELVRSLAGTSSQERAVDGLGDRLLSAWRDASLPIVVGHGDFKLANCVFDPHDGRLTGVIDWGAGFGPDAALYDYSFLLVDFEARCHGTPLPRTLSRWIRPEGLSADDRRRLSGFAQRLSLPCTDETIGCLGAYQWLKRMAPLAEGYECRRFDFRYVDAMFSSIGGSK